MLDGLWFMVDGLCFMVYGLWFMVDGLWFMVYGFMVYMVYGLYGSWFWFRVESQGFMARSRGLRVSGSGIGTRG